MWEVNCSWELFSCLTANSCLDEGGPLHKDYLKNCQSLLANGTLTDLNDDAVVQYMNIVWARMTKEGQYKAWLSRKRSNAYQALQNSFQAKWVVSVTCSHLLVCLNAWAYSGHLPLACLSLWFRDVWGMWCHRKGSSIPQELPAVMEPAKNFFLFWLLPQVSHPRVSVDW
jgi:hypothetical protein